MTWYLFIAGWAVFAVVVFAWATKPPHRRSCSCHRRLRDIGVYDADCPEHGVPPLRRVA